MGEGKGGTLQTKALIAIAHTHPGEGTSPVSRKEHQPSTIIRIWTQNYISGQAEQIK